MVVNRKWIRVSKRHRCPICDHADWCGYSEDGELAICMRTPSDIPSSNGGYVHVLKASQEAPVRVRRIAPVRRRLFDAERAMAGFRSEYEGPECEPWVAAARLGEELGLNGAIVDRLEPGISGFYRAWCFPMRDGNGKVVGIRLREIGTGRKWSVSGSVDGLFYDPDMTPGDGSDGCRYREIVVCEGASDAAAGYEIGLPCVGRSSCATGSADLLTLCSRLRVNRVTIIADNDSYKSRIARSACGAPVRRRWQPGIDGAEKLARDMKRMYRIVRPPAKDLRDWVTNGCDARTFRMVCCLHQWRIP